MQSILQKNLIRLFLIVRVSVAAAGSHANLHPDQPYLIANGLPGHESRAHTLLAPGYATEYFEVYSLPIEYRYSEVYWRVQDPVPLPPDIVGRYNASAIAITGWEVDVIRKDASGNESSVPCYESYNHHFSANINGRTVHMQDTTGLYPSHGAGGDQIRYERVPEVLPALLHGAAQIPGVQSFNEHNGNEHRQSYHGLPKGMVQPIYAPQSFTFSPMQINLRNPDGSGRRCPGGLPGNNGTCPLPHSSRAPPGARYSGLLECPCTTRTEIRIDGHGVRKRGTCTGRGADVTSSKECFAAAHDLGLSPVLANVTVSDSKSPRGCFVVRSTDGFHVTYNGLASSTVACGASSGGSSSGGQIVSGVRESLVTLGVSMDANLDLVNVTLKGPSDKWFGVGFDASRMADRPYAMIVDGEGSVTERRLGTSGDQLGHDGGRLLAPSVQVLSNTVEGGVRTMLLSRPLAGKTANHYTFDASLGSLDFINALGGSAAFGEHLAKASATIILSELGATTCVCRSGGGSINGVPYNPHCTPAPKSDLLPQHNPTCNVETYVGGLACCKGGVFLLDEDQEVPPLVDTVHFKWRFYFTDYDPSVQTPTMHLEWQFGHIEYDVVQAPPGTPPQEAIHELKSDFTTRDMMDLYSHPDCDVVTEPYCADSNKVTEKGIALIMAGGHCHAPACLSLELYNRDTGALLCRIEPAFGQSDSALDEDAYLWLPPCVWGSGDAGLAPAPVLHLDTNLTTIKKANSTYYHYGVMAIWQMRGIYL